MKKLVDYVGKLKTTLKPGEGYFLGDDWRTQGDWIGRYGREFAKIFGANGVEAKLADRDFSGASKCNVEVALGPHREADRTEPSRKNEKADAENRGALFDPILGQRIVNEISDARKEPYATEWEGPDLFVKVSVPDGTHRVSLYFQNSGAQTENKFRDYEIELWPKDDAPFFDENSEPLALARANDFAGGVYKQFVLAGPGEFQFRIARNRSFVTALQGVFIDRLPLSLSIKQPMAGLEDFVYEPPQMQIPANSNPAVLAAVKLWSQFDGASSKRGAAGLMLPFRVLAFRAVLSGGAIPDTVANLRWQLNFWNQKERGEFDAAAKRMHEDFSKKHPEGARSEAEKK